MTRAERVSQGLGLAHACVALAACAVLAALAPPVRSGTPPFPVAATGAPFPGGALEPATARQAGLALAEYWLGDDAFNNPAGAIGPSGGSVTPLFLRSSRQDLRAVYRQFDEQTGNLDLASAQLRAGNRYGGAALYFGRPWNREEGQAYLLGDITAPPAVRDAEFTSREQNVGVAVATSGAVAGGRLAVGMAAEWLRREDRYRLVSDTDGLPLDVSKVRFQGEGLAGQLGLRWDGWRDGEAGGPRLRVGAAWRHVGALRLGGLQELGVLNGDTVIALAVRREATDHFGASARAEVSRALSVSATLGRRGEDAYRDLDLGAGPGALWAAGLAYHDPRAGWGVWIGTGQDQLDGTPEPRTTLLGLGLEAGYKNTSVALGVLRRNSPSDVQPEGPHWYAYRLLATLHVSL